MDDLRELCKEMIEWEPAEERETRNGKMWLRKCPELGKEFWKLWREYKDEMKDMGISVYKDDETGDFTAKWWSDEADGEMVPMAKEGGNLPWEGPDQFISKSTRDSSGWRLKFCEDILRPYQVLAARTIFEILSEDADFSLDASDTGLGKTYIACAAAKNLGHNVAVVCPANVVTKWTDTLMDVFDICPEFVLSYDKLRGGKTDYVSRKDKVQRGKTVTGYVWNVVAPVLIIFDEIHCCSAIGSKNAELLRAAIRNEYVMIHGISATAVMSPLTMSVIGQGLELHNGNDWWDWCLKNGCRDGVFGGLDFSSKPGTKGEMALKRIHHHIFPDKGCRLRRAELGDILPEAEILVEIFDDYEETDLEPLNMCLAAIAAKEREDEERAISKVKEVSPLTENVRARQRAEALKVPGMFDKMVDLLGQGYHVAIFLNFTGSIVMFETMLHGLKDVRYRKLIGGVSKVQFEEQRSSFQRGEAPVCLVQTDAGSAAIDLHDTVGNSPRAALISPGYSAHKLLQATGRVDRDGRKSPCIQFICFSADQVEKRCAKLVQAKLANLSLLNDGDLEGMLKVVAK